MKYSYEEKLNYEINRIRDSKEFQDSFFRKAVDIQKSDQTYSAVFAVSKMEFACEVLKKCGYCSERKCEDCELYKENCRALDEIRMEIRPCKNVSKECGYFINAATTKNGEITITLKPFNKEV